MKRTKGFSLTRLVLSSKSNSSTGSSFNYDCCKPLVFSRGYLRSKKSRVKKGREVKATNGKNMYMQKITNSVISARIEDVFRKTYTEAVGIQKASTTATKQVTARLKPPKSWKEFYFRSVNTPEEFDRGLVYLDKWQSAKKWNKEEAANVTSDDLNAMLCREIAAAGARADQADKVLKLFDARVKHRTWPDYRAWSVLAKHYADKGNVTGVKKVVNSAKRRETTEKKIPYLSKLQEMIEIATAKEGEAAAAAVAKEREALEGAGEVRVKTVEIPVETKEGEEQPKK